MSIPMPQRPSPPTAVILPAAVAVPSGRTVVEPDGRAWTFESGSLALDFAHAAPVAEAASLTAWLDERFGGIVAEADEREARDSAGLAGAIDRLVAQATAGDPLGAGDVDIVNLFAATPDIPPTLTGGSRQAGRSRVRVGQTLSTIAREAARILSGDVDARLRECEADDCSLVYLDTSRAGSRRWCSMQRCGNRAKVRAHRARARSVARGEDPAGD